MASIPSISVYYGERKSYYSILDTKADLKLISDAIYCPIKPLNFKYQIENEQFKELTNCFFNSFLGLFNPLNMKALVQPLMGFI